MNGSPNAFPATFRSHFVHWALVLICGVLCSALLGATRAQAVKSSKKAALHQTKIAAAAGTELLHSAAPAEAQTAAFVLPGVQSRNKTLRVLVTAYCGCTICCGPNARGITASGKLITYNDGQFVAADTRLFKFGTRLQIPGYADGKPVEVIDRGGAIKGYHIDVYFPTHEQAREWGKKWITVTVAE